MAGNKVNAKSDNQSVAQINWQAHFNGSESQLIEVQAYIESIKHPEFSVHQILSGFTELLLVLTDKEQKGELVSLRTLSALCFSGDSKFLDQRRKFIETIFPIANKVLEPRVIMLSAYIPENLQRAIFIENFESFRATVRALKRTEYSKTTAVIYSAGYRSSAALIREQGQCQFVSINHVDETNYQLFLGWWHSVRQDIPVVFWGDLDFDGLRILKSLRASFSNAIAFKSAYAAVVNLHQKGISHSSLNPNKGRQKDPGKTGCEYADKILLPTVRKDNKFTDQEVIGVDQITEALNVEFSN